MANLIITVISIALVAVAALMGAYYGGSAFLDGQTKSKANTIVSGFDQMTSAWTLYAANNNGSYNGLTTINSLVPEYISQVPKLPSTIGNYSTTNYLDQEVWLSIEMNDPKICEQINFILSGIATLTPSGSPKKSCGLWYIDGGGINHYLISYKIKG